MRIVRAGNRSSEGTEFAQLMVLALPWPRRLILAVCSQGLFAEVGCASSFGKYAFIGMDSISAAKSWKPGRQHLSRTATAPSTTGFPEEIRRKFPLFVRFSPGMCIDLAEG
jgi:hypothetical protein